MQMAQTGYLLQTTNSTVDGAVLLPANEVNVAAHAWYARYAYFFSLGGKTAAVQAMAPYVFIDADILGISRNQSGFGDALLVIGSNITGGEAMPFAQFAQHLKKPALA